jgi:hypothetical protein
VGPADYDSTELRHGSRVDCGPQRAARRRSKLWLDRCDASELDDFAVLLRVHGIDHLADQLDVVQVALSESDTFDADGHQHPARLRNTG